MLPDVPFARPDAATSRRPAPAASTRARVLRDFEAGPAAGGGRAGELDPARWSARARQPGSTPPASATRIRIGPALAAPAARISPTRACCRRRRRADLRSDRDDPDASPADRRPPRRTTASTPIASASRSTSRAARAPSSSTWISTNDGLGGWPRDRDRPGPVARAQLRLAGARLRPAQRRRDRVQARLVQHAADAVMPVVYTLSTTTSQTVPETCPRRSTARSRTPRPRPARSTTSRSTSPRRTSRCGCPTRRPTASRFPDLQMLCAGDIELPFSRGYVSLVAAQPRDDQVLAAARRPARAGTTSGSTGPWSTGAREVQRRPTP